MGLFDAPERKVNSSSGCPKAKDRAQVLTVMRYMRYMFVRKCMERENEFPFIKAYWMDWKWMDGWVDSGNFNWECQSFTLFFLLLL